MHQTAELTNDSAPLPFAHHLRLLQDMKGNQDVVKTGKLSSLQLEAVAYACQTHETRLPDGSRAGFFIGDGAGVRVASVGTRGRRTIVLVELLFRQCLHTALAAVLMPVFCFQVQCWKTNVTIAGIPDELLLFAVLKKSLLSTVVGG